MRAILFCLLCVKVLATKNDEGMKLQSIKFKAPELTEEETESNYVPDELKCDACHAVAFQIRTALERSEERKRSKKILAESDVLDTLWPLCEEGFEQYGLKEVDGIHRLSGPGLDTSDSPGLVQMGGKWPRRIRDICSVLIGDFGEMEIYELFRSAPSKLESKLCAKRCPKASQRKTKHSSSTKTEL